MKLHQIQLMHGESLIEANLVLDREDAVFSIRERMLAGPIEINEYLLTVIEILVRFRWENEYRDLLENIKLRQIDGLEIGIAKIFPKARESKWVVGDIEGNQILTL